MLDACTAFPFPFVSCEGWQVGDCHEKACRSCNAGFCLTKAGIYGCVEAGQSRDTVLCFMSVSGQGI